LVFTTRRLGMHAEIGALLCARILRFTLLSVPTMTGVKAD